MISTLLAEHAPYVRWVLLGLAVVMVAVGAVLVRRDPRRDASRSCWPASRACRCSA